MKQNLLLLVWTFVEGVNFLLNIVKTS